jgi:hypothetical protein
MLCILTPNRKKPLKAGEVLMVSDSALDGNACRAMRKTAPPAAVP